MKTIFIAIDFTSASVDACRYGFSLAQRWSARVVLFHAFKTAISIPEAFAVIDAADLKKTAEFELNKLAKEILGENQLKYDVLAADGDAADLINMYTPKYDDCLIVCGMKKDGKFLKRLFGDTITELIKHITVPILIVPEQTTYKPISHISMATDFQLDTDIKTLTPILSMAKINESRLSVVRVMSTSASVIEELNFRSERITDYLSACHPEFVFLKSDDVAEGINNFIKSKNSDLLVMITHPHSFMERVFDKSESRSILFELSVPLLLLPELKIFNGGKQQKQSPKYNRV